MSAWLAILALLPESPLLARTWHLDPEGTGDAATIQAAIDAAAPADVLELACGLYLEHDLVLKSGITLRSATGRAECVILDAQELGRVLVCEGVDATTVIEGVTLTRGRTDLEGGGVLCLSSDPVFRECVFLENSAVDGGAMMCRASSPTLIDCAFLANHANSGGGVVCVDGSQPEFVGCRFEGNSAGRWGGGMIVSDASPTLTSCTFRENSADIVGGALECYLGGSPSLEECTFTGNTSGQGGAVFVFSSSPVFLRCTFHGNAAVGTSEDFADGSGGALLFWNETDGALLDCTFRENSCAGDHGGGAVFCFRSSPRISNSTFVENTSAGSGGALGLNSDCSPEISGCRFLRNAAEGWGGGAIRGWNECNATITNCVFSDNTVGVSGGGIAIQLSAPTISNCSFVRNTAQQGGGLHCLESSPLVRSCTFYGNGASNWGGGVYAVESSFPVIENTIIAFGADGPSVTCHGSFVTLRCSDVYGNAGGDWVGCLVGQLGVDGNFSLDPLFCNPEGDDFTLEDDSPCAPPGITGCGLVGALPATCEPISVVPESWTRVKSRYRSSDR